MGVKGLRGNTGGKFYWLLSKKEKTGSMDKKKTKQNKTKHKKLCLSNPQHADNWEQNYCIHTKANEHPAYSQITKNNLPLFIALWWGVSGF